MYWDSPLSHTPRLRRTVMVIPLLRLGRKGRLFSGRLSYSREESIEQGWKVVRVH